MVRNRAMELVESKWRLRGEGYAITIVLAAILVIRGIVHAGNPLQLIVGVFPVVIGWIGSVIALELGLARGEGRAAIRSSITLGCVVALANLLVVLGAFHVMGLL